MMTMLSNKQPMKYALYLGSAYKVQTEEDGNPRYYEDDDGNRIYHVTGEPKDFYGEPQEFDANFSEAGGEAEAQEYGLSTADYEGVIMYGKGAYPITIGALIWKDSEVEYDSKTNYYTKDLHELIEVHSPSRKSADFVVMKTPDSLNFTRLILEAINK